MIPDFIREIGLGELLDILFMWVILYTLLVWSKTTRSAAVLKGILIVAGIYLITRYFNMVLASGLLEKFFAIILIALVVIFQEELRHLFENIAMWRINPSLRKKSKQQPTREEVDILIRTLTDLAKSKIGALIVIRGKDLLLRHLDGGISLEGRISEALLKSIFDPNSIGHDGAVYIEGNRIVRFACHLPLSKDTRKLTVGGTRHAAALGLSERCDALCLVASEERGTISVVQQGSITIVKDPADLKRTIEDFYERIQPRLPTKPLQGFLQKNYREKLLGLLFALLLWFILVYGAKNTYRTFIVPVAYEPPPPPLQVVSLSPEKVYMTLGGKRNAFYFFQPKQIGVSVEVRPREGKQTARVYPTNIRYPQDLTLELLMPREIEFILKTDSEEKPKLEKDQSPNLLDALKKVVPVLPSKPQPEKTQPNPSTENTKPAAQENPPPSADKVLSVDVLKDSKPEDVVKFIKENPNPPVQEAQH